MRPTCMTRRRVVALLQSLLSSRHSRMYSRCSIFSLTMASTWRALVCSPVFRLPGAAEMRPGVSMMVRLGQYLYSIFTTISLDQNWPSRSSRAFSVSMCSCTRSVERSKERGVLGEHSRALRRPTP